MSKEPNKSGAPGKSPGTKRKLTREEKKQIAAIIRQAKGDGKAHTAQQTIPYLNLYPDGICRITEKKYSKSIVFEDINYQLAQADDKTAIFENWCDFLNYFDASVSVQLSFINQIISALLGKDLDQSICAIRQHLTNSEHAFETVYHSGHMRQISKMLSSAFAEQFPQA